MWYNKGVKDDLKKMRHERSKLDYPGLKLEQNEYVELAIRRTKFGVWLIWALVATGFATVTCVIVLLATTGGVGPLGINEAAKHYLYILLFGLYAVILLAGAIGSYVYNGNYMYITNRRIFQTSMTHLLSRSTNVIDLLSVEDVSFAQNGILAHLFRYGTIRMSTIGDETTYTFKYIDKPNDEMDTITHLVHKAKERTKRANGNNN